MLLDLQLSLSLSHLTHFHVILALRFWSIPLQDLLLLVIKFKKLWRTTRRVMRMLASLMHMEVTLLCFLL
jgi:hypothetical protein